jgi:hypothetical protein
VVALPVYLSQGEFMLPRLVLLLAQFWIGWDLASYIVRWLPTTQPNIRIFIFALVAAIVVWLIGHVGALVLKDTAAPSPATLTFVLLFALIGALVAQFEVVTRTINGILRLRAISTEWYPMVGAVLGYLIKR